MRKLPPGDILASSKQLVLIVAPVLYFFFSEFIWARVSPFARAEKNSLGGAKLAKFLLPTNLFLF